MPVIEAIQVMKHYEEGRSRIPVLKGIDLVLERGEVVALEATSGKECWRFKPQRRGGFAAAAGMVERDTLGYVRRGQGHSR